MSRCLHLRSDHLVMTAVMASASVPKIVVAVMVAAPERDEGDGIPEAVTIVAAAMVAAVAPVMMAAIMRVSGASPRREALSL